MKIPLDVLHYLVVPKGNSVGLFVFSPLILSPLKLIKKLSFVLKMVFPSNRMEWAVFCFFVLGYTTLAMPIALDYRIVFDNRIPWDAYFSFDNRAIVMTGGGFERHPLANYYFNWIRELALFVSGGKMDSTFRFVLSGCSVFMVSLTLVQIFKYLREIIQLPNVLSCLLLVFFSLFATNILLSFTPETYTYSLFFLTLFNYYAARKLRSGRKFSIAALTIFTVTIGGLTVTNAAKVYIGLLYEKGLFKSLKSFGNAVVRGAIAVGVFVLLFLYRMNFDYGLILSKTTEQYEKFSKPKVTPLWDMISSWFLGGNVLFSGFITRDYHNKKAFEYKALFMDVYTSWVPYLFVGVLFSLLVWSWIKNRKNKMVQILFFLFFFDFLIHCVLKFGLHTSYIYGGHFVMVYPLVLGWLLYSYRKQTRILTSLIITLILMTLYLALNNAYRMQEFFDFLNLYYR
ncbi:DUF6080 domain-containing protein [Chryseobacterium sp. A301]